MPLTLLLDVGVYVSEHLIWWIAALILAASAATKVILIDLHHIVVLYKKLKATIKGELPPGDSG